MGDLHPHLFYFMCFLPVVLWGEAGAVVQLPLLQCNAMLC